MSNKPPAFSTEDEFYTDLLNRYSQSMANAAIKFGASTDSVEDIIQESVARIYMHHDTVSRLDRRALVSYIWHTVRSVTLNYLRDDLKTIDLETAERAQIESPEDLLLITENRSLLAKSIEKLPEREKELLIEKYFLGWSCRELSEQHRISEGNVRIILMRARKNLKEIMEKEEKQ
ncbi:MAG: sigma-70 family RNA polymerase sigma factor [Oscillospiraceae bacterium]|nr:sigma-70 family RNA polymerase sigma factor [Oscillospiraceae bacterium]